MKEAPHLKMRNDDGSVNSSGSWWPLIIVVTIVLTRWLSVSDNRLVARLRRSLNMKVCSILLPAYCFMGCDNVFNPSFFICIQRVELKNRLGYRDNTAYSAGSAGEGASRSVKRQG